MHAARTNGAACTRACQLHLWNLPPPLPAGLQNWKRWGTLLLAVYKIKYFRLQKFKTIGTHYFLLEIVF